VQNKDKTVLFLLLLFPIVLSIGIFTIPYVSDYSNVNVQNEAVEHSLRWFLGHIVSAIAFSIAIITAHMISQYLSNREQSQIGKVGFMCIALGGTFLSIGLGADGIGPLAITSEGLEASVFFEGSGMMVTGVFMIGIVLFSLGLINQIVGLRRTGLVSKPLSTALICCAIFLMGVSAIPSSFGLYFIAYLSILIYGSLAYFLWRSQSIQD
jgi:hypothetical protein